jgi:hypothetical protein
MPQPVEVSTVWRKVYFAAAAVDLKQAIIIAGVAAAGVCRCTHLKYGDQLSKKSQCADARSGQWLLLRQVLHKTAIQSLRTPQQPQRTCTICSMCCCTSWGWGSANSTRHSGSTAGVVSDKSSCRNAMTQGPTKSAQLAACGVCWCKVCLHTRQQCK